MKKSCLVVLFALVTIGFTGLASAVEPEPNEPVEQGSPELPPQSPESTCAEWPYCIITGDVRNQ
ncbi:hypothetical protein [Rheinheimera tilapiae]|uniref:Uncharacterized protein n=1 Tax=Rheinheimera tilapiae TaxID=875043 RepID=A0ABV6BDF4_9GAMM